MSISFRRGFLFAVLLLLPLFAFEAHMRAQPDASRGAEIVWGRIENLSAGGSAVVVLRESSSGRLLDQKPVGYDGSFRLQGATSGSRGYSLEVRDGQRLLHEEYVLPLSLAGEIRVTIRAPKVQPSADGTVSVARLLHAPPAKAARLFDKAMTAGDLRESIELLEKAVEAHPEYIEARHNLAVRLGRLRQYDRAVEQFKAVLELDPSSAMAWANLGIALDALGDAEAAETAAKQALALEPRSAPASFLLGFILLRRGVNLAAAAELLGNAATQFPVAGLLQVDALLAAGETAPARHALHSLVAAANGVH
jgi:tetratricopeptide (TPR) repeat protein